jgi:hypothetical protein
MNQGSIIWAHLVYMLGGKKGVCFPATNKCYESTSPPHSTTSHKITTKFTISAPGIFSCELEQSKVGSQTAPGGGKGPGLWDMVRFALGKLEGRLVAQ